MNILKYISVVSLSALITFSGYADNISNNISDSDSDKAPVKSVNLSDEEIKTHINLKEVIIKASRLGVKYKNLPGKVELITSDIIANTSVSNLGELLRKTTGIDVMDYGGMLASISLRGFAPKSGENNYTVILIDGIPSGTKNIAALSLNNIESVEILKGPYSSLYGSQAMGGVINIITKKDGGNIHSNLSLGYGSYDTRKLSFDANGNIAPKLSFTLSASHENRKDDFKYGDEHFFRMGSQKREYRGFGKDDLNKIENASYKKSDLSARLNYKAGENVNFYAAYSYFTADDVFNPGMIFSDFPFQTVKDIDRHNYSVGTVIRKGMHTISADIYQSVENTKDYDGIDEKRFVNLDRDYKVVGAQINDKFSIGRHHLSYGIDYKKDKNSSHRWDSDNNPTMPYQPDSYNSKFAGYAQFNLSVINERLFVSGGARADFIKLHIDEDEDMSSEKVEESFNRINYNIGAKYHFNNMLSVYSSFGTAFLSPMAIQKVGSYEYSYNMGGYSGTERYKGNPKLDPEKSSTLELGINCNTDNLTAGISWFNTDYRDKITTVDVIPKNETTGEPDLKKKFKTYENADKARMNGIEADFSYKFKNTINGRCSIEPYIKWTWLYHTKEKIDRNKDGNEDSDNKYSDFLFVKEHVGLAGLRFDNSESFSASANIKYGGTRKETKFNYETFKNDIISMPEYLTVDFSASYKICRIVSVSVYANNIFDERYCEKYGYFMPGRNFLAKLNINF